MCELINTCLRILFPFHQNERSKRYGLSLTGFISHILRAEIKSVLPDPERQGRAHHAAETNGREIVFSFILTLYSLIYQHKHTHFT